MNEYAIHRFIANSYRLFNVCIAELLGGPWDIWLIGGKPPVWSLAYDTHHVVTNGRLLQLSEEKLEAEVLTTHSISDS